MDSKKNYRWLWWIVLAGALVRVVMWCYFAADTLALVTERLPDDALYYFTIANNLIHGSGISFDGLHPTNGMHPLWLFTIAPLFALGLGKWAAIHAVLLLQSVLDVVIIGLVGRTVFDVLAMRDEATRKRAAGVAALLYALSPVVLVRSTNGLETTLTALLLVVWLRIFTWHAHRETYANLADRIRTLAPIGFVTGLLLLARTDSFLILLPLGIASLLKPRSWNIGWSQWALISVVAALVLLPWFAWNLSTFGSIVQSSAEAVPLLAMKKYDVLYGHGLPTYLHLLPESIKNGLKPFWLSTFGLSFLTVGFCLLTRRRELTASHRAVFLLLAGGIVLLLTHTLLRGFVRDWYSEELLPIFAIGYGVSIGLNAGSAALTNGVWHMAGIILIAQLLLVRHAQFPSQAVLLRMGVPLTEELARTHNIASFNSGYNGYFSPRAGAIVNIDGVVNIEALSAIKQGALQHGTIKQGALRDYLDRDSVDYILDFEGDFGGYVNLIDKQMLEHYSLDTVFSAGDERLALYRHAGVKKGTRN